MTLGEMARDVFGFAKAVLPEVLGRLAKESKTVDVMYKAVPEVFAELGSLWEKHGGDAEAARRDIRDRRALIAKKRRARDKELAEKHHSGNEE